MTCPKISIVTPSYNQSHFIEETILSVLGQKYPNLEYIIIDGGSTDNTVDIIKKYEKQITYWVSEKDNGQSHAINKGFENATGEIFGWLNSDDLYMPGTLKFIAEKFQTNPNHILFGDCIHFKEESGIQSWGSQVTNLFNKYSLKHFDFIIQPSTFWTKQIWILNGVLNENIEYAFDWEWFLRAESKGIAFSPIDKVLSMYRIHSNHKSGTGGNKRQQEIWKLYAKYCPKYATLYQFLINYNLKRVNFGMRVMRKMNKLLHTNYDNHRLLKFCYPNQLKDYTVDEIQKVSQML